MQCGSYLNELFFLFSLIYPIGVALQEAYNNRGFPTFAVDFCILSSGSCSLRRFLCANEVYRWTF